MNSLGIYISVPFCRAKCSYCNFASGVSSVSAHEQYVARVCSEIRTVRQRLGTAAIPDRWIAFTLAVARRAYFPRPW